MTLGNPTTGIAGVELIGDVDHDGTPDFATNWGQPGFPGVVTVHSGKDGISIVQSFGFGFLSLEVDTVATIGVGSVYVQVLYPDPGTPAGFVATEGIALTFE